jgi:hypothetical protein
VISKVGEVKTEDEVPIKGYNNFSACAACTMGAPQALLGHEEAAPQIRKDGRCL